MNKQVVPITIEESEHVEDLFNQFNGYLNVLSFFGDKAVEENSVFDRKWAEAVQISIDLEKAKVAIEKKYRPEGDWEQFEFDFDNHQVIFYAPVI